MCEAKNDGLCVCATSDGLPETPAGRLEFLLDLTAPVVGVDEDGLPIRDPKAGAITPEQMRRVLEEGDDSPDAPPIGAEGQEKP
jgi:hypothetical protein